MKMRIGDKVYSDNGKLQGEVVCEGRDSVQILLSDGHLFHIRGTWKVRR